MWDTAGAHGRVDGRSTGTLAGRTSAWLNGVFGDAGSGDDTLLRAIHAEAERPAVIVLVEHTDELTSAEFQFVLHRRPKVQLDAMYVVRGSDGRRTSGGRARRLRDIISPCRAWGNGIALDVDTWRGKLLVVVRWLRSVDRDSGSSDNRRRHGESIHFRVPDEVVGRVRSAVDGVVGAIDCCIVGEWILRRAGRSGLWVAERISRGSMSSIGSTRSLP